jgi:putative acetyltransferase
MQCCLHRASVVRNTRQYVGVKPSDAHSQSSGTQVKHRQASRKPVFFVFMDTKIREVDAAHDLDRFRALLQEYNDTSPPGRFSSRMAEDLAALPGRYAAPTGGLYLLSIDGTATGTAAWTRVNDRQAEIKRVYVTPARRGQGLALRLSQAIIDAARERGYAELVLSTWDDNANAIALYRKLGFVEIEPFKTSPILNLTYMGLTL